MTYESGGQERGLRGAILLGAVSVIHKAMRLGKTSESVSSDKVEDLNVVPEVLLH